MKKLFAVMIVAAAITACNDNTKTEQTRSADSTTTVTPAAPDTSSMKMDTTQGSKMADTTKSKM